MNSWTDSTFACLNWIEWNDDQPLLSRPFLFLKSAQSSTSETPSRVKAFLDPIELENQVLSRSEHELNTSARNNDEEAENNKPENSTARMINTASDESDETFTIDEALETVGVGAIDCFDFDLMDYLIDWFAWL